jgi:hypothetical protein
VFIHNQSLRRKTLLSQNEPYEEPIGYTRGSLWAPFHAVGMVLRIKGDIPTEQMEAALRKLQVLYPPLASRVRLEKNGAAWLTTQAVQAATLEVRTDAAGDDWKKLFLEQERIPFAFERGPIGRFFLLRGQLCSDLIAIVPHVICDGYAMTEVITDLVALLNDPHQPVTRRVPAPAVTWQSAAHATRDARLLRGLIKVFNRVWPQSQARIHQAEYERLHQNYWEHRQNGLLAFELSAAQTSDLAARCKQYGVKITGALVAAFLLAQESTRTAARVPLWDVTVAVNIRNQMVQPPGRVMAVYASNINLRMHPRPGARFWDLAGQCHSRIHRALGDRARLLLPLALGELDPSFSDAGLAGMSSGQISRRLGRLARYVRFEGLNPNLDVSNVGQVDLPEAGAAGCPVTIIPVPPLWPAGGLAINVLTVNDRMNVTVKFRLDQLDEAAVIKIGESALSYLTGG